MLGGCFYPNPLAFFACPRGVKAACLSLYLCLPFQQGNSRETAGKQEANRWQTVNNLSLFPVYFYNINE